MGSALEFGTQMSKLLIISIRACFRSVCNHPFPVGFLYFLFLLYRSFPFVFSILVSASPVLICTAVLLGTLLSFGQHSVPEVEKEEKVTHEISSHQTGISEGATVIAERDESFVVERYKEKRSDIEERGIKEATLAGDVDNKVEENDAYVQPVDESSRAIQHERHVNEEAERRFHNLGLEKKREVNEKLGSERVSSDEEALEEQYVMVEKENDEILDIENEKSPVKADDGFNEDHLNFSPSSSWKHVENNDEEEDSLESGSDQAESSSPDASMADIMPMLDELHPLLDLETPQAAHLSQDGSDAASGKSHKSDEDSGESEEDNENQIEVEDGVDEEEEEMEGGKEDESKSAIKWTEDDQKNLMDLGTSELERNQRLENLIARRRARKNLIMTNERNLIDLEGFDLSFNVAPIATTRRNPFDLPDNSYTAMGLPPIPGSAPSILQPRRNPFDIPYDSSEEKPDLKGDSFQREFMMFNQKDPFFRRYESFSLGPSGFGMTRQERQDLKWKPVFVAERMTAEGTSYSSFQRQSSEVSDSKLSSVPDTESVSSSDQDETKLNEQDLSPEAELTCNADNASDGVKHGSQSSEDNDSVDMMQVKEGNVNHEEAEIVLGGVENPSEIELYSETGEVEVHEEGSTGNIHLRREPISEVSSTRSSQTSISEVIDNIPGENKEEPTSLQAGDNQLQSSVDESEFLIVRGESEENQHKEPVYDSSPPRILSSSSVSSDTLAELSARVSPSASIAMTHNLTEKEPEVHDQRLEGNTSGHEENPATSSQLHMEAKSELRSRGPTDKNQHDLAGYELSVVGRRSVDQNAYTAPQSVAVQVVSSASDVGSRNGVGNTGFVHEQHQADYHGMECLPKEKLDSPVSDYHMASENSHSSDNESVEEGAVRDGVDSSSSHSRVLSEAVQGTNEKLNSVASDSQQMPSGDSSMFAHQDLQPSLGPASLVHDDLPSEETQRVDFIKEDLFQVEQDKVDSSYSAEQGTTDIQQDFKKVVSPNCDYHDMHYEVKSPSDVENNQSNSDRSVVAPYFSDHNDNQQSSIMEVKSRQVASTSNAGAGEVYTDGMVKIALNISSLTFDSSETPEFKSPMSEADLEVNMPGKVTNEQQNEGLEHYKSLLADENIKESDEIKEIDEGFLSELDTVGDFSIGDAAVSFHPDLTPREVTVEDARVDSLPKDVEIAEVDQDIPILEARSLEDIDFAFKKLKEGADVKEAILPTKVKDQVSSKESNDHLEAQPDLQLEARSVDEIDIALKKVSEGNNREPPKSLELIDGSIKTDAKVSANKTGFFDVPSTEQVTKTPGDQLENVPTSSSSSEVKSHGRKSSSGSSSSTSSSSSSSDSD